MAIRREAIFLHFKGYLLRAYFFIQPLTIFDTLSPG